MNKCQAGHKKHKTKVVPTRIGPMYVYDTDSYPNEIEGYCNGKDDISRTLITKGSWEDFETTSIIQLLQANRDYNENQLVVDMGSHIGWYSLIAANLGYEVISIDADKENLSVLEENAKLHRVSDLIVTKHHWIDKSSKALRLPDGNKEIELVKADVEGNESAAISMIEPLLAARNIKHVAMELSPDFNGDSAEIIKVMYSYGFKALVIGIELEALILEGEIVGQKNILFKRNDLP